MATFKVTINGHDCYAEGTTMQEIEDDIVAAAYFGERHGWNRSEMIAAFPEYMEMCRLQRAINHVNGTISPIRVPMTATAEEAIVRFRMDHPEIT